MAEPPSDLILYRLMLVAGFVGEDFSRRYARVRISLTEWRVLFELHLAGPDHASAIARRTGLRPMTVSRAVAALQQAGRISREAEADRRRQRLVITPRGEALVRRMRPEAIRLEADLLHPLSASERAALDAALQTMLQQARARAGSA